MLLTKEQRAISDRESVQLTRLDAIALQTEKSSLRPDSKITHERSQ